MNELEHKILRKFEREPSRELSTSEVVQEALSEEYRWIKGVLSEVREKAQLGLAKRKKGQLHRKVLYYLNKLMEEEEIIQTKVRGKGEKYFVLNVQKKRLDPHHFFESARVQLITPIEGYEKQGLIRKLDREAWSTRVSSVIINASKFSGIFKLQNAVSECFQWVNEVVGIYGFEKIIEEGALETIQEGLHQLDLEGKDFNRKVCLLVNVNQASTDKLKRFAEGWVCSQPEKIKIIWGLSARWLEEHQELGGYILKLFGKHKQTLFMDNLSLGKAPAFWGEGGIHRLSLEEWECFLRSTMEVGLCTVCTLSVDVGRFFNGERSFQEFRSLVRKAAKSLFLGNWAVQDHGMAQFATLNRMDANPRLFYHLGSNQLRFMNFPTQGVEAEHFLSLLESCQSEVERFVKVQETILKSCGMPLRFKVAWGVDGLGDLKEEGVVSKMQDFFKPEFQEYIRHKEHLTKVFAGKDILQCVTLSGDSEEWFNQLRYILNHIQVPLVSLSFGEEKGIIKLTSFLEVSHGNS